jgi:hypothetical protein
MAKSTAINWTTGRIAQVFKLNRVYYNFPLLEDWLKVENTLTETDITMLDYRRDNLLRRVNSWNEETLKMKFIAFILDMVQYDSATWEGIFETEMSATIDGHSLKVITDFTVAKVFEDLIERPYFYFHEYKAAKKKSKDPIAQVLLAMLIAQEKNQDGKPIYGCHVIGENWYFMVMHGRDYAIASSLDSTSKEDLQTILLILRKFKDILLTKLAV